MAGEKTEETVQCSVCSEEVAVRSVVIIRQWAICSDCVADVYGEVQRILEERGCQTQAILPA